MPSARRERSSIIFVAGKLGLFVGVVVVDDLQSTNLSNWITLFLYSALTMLRGRWAEALQVPHVYAQWGDQL